MQEQQSCASNWSVFTLESNMISFWREEQNTYKSMENAVANLYQDHRLYFATDIPFATLDEQDQIIICNAAFLEFFRKVEIAVLGKSVYDIIPEDIYLDYFEIIEQFFVNLREKQNASVLIFEDEDHYYKVQGIYIEKDRIHLTIHDLSLDKRYENLLTYQRQIESVSHMAASIAHELRNPLTVIKGFLQLSGLTNNYSVYYDTIMSELERMNGIIEDFLSVSRKQRVRKYLQPQEFMESIIEIIKPECILHNVTFDFEIERTEETIYVNEGMIKQVFLNLLRNSIDAFKEQGDGNFQFYIEGQLKDDQYEIIVGDNGPGMIPKVLDNLGRPFITTKELGSGIGLPLCKKIIQDHGGRFEVSSKINDGTRIQIVLPLAKKDTEEIDRRENLEI